jgi:hypothetical protein
MIGVHEREESPARGAGAFVPQLADLQAGQDEHARAGAAGDLGRFVGGPVVHDDHFHFR